MCGCEDPDDNVKMGETGYAFPESLYQHETESYTHTFYIFLSEELFGAIENTVLGCVCRVALVTQTGLRCTCGRS